MLARNGPADCPPTVCGTAVFVLTAGSRGEHLPTQGVHTLYPTRRTYVRAAKLARAFLWIRARDVRTHACDCPVAPALGTRRAPAIQWYARTDVFRAWASLYRYFSNPTPTPSP